MKTAAKHPRGLMTYFISGTNKASTKVITNHMLISITRLIVSGVQKDWDEHGDGL